VKVASQVPLGAGNWNLALYVSDLYYFLSVPYTSPFLCVFCTFCGLFSEIVVVVIVVVAAAAVYCTPWHRK
jgi:uncharacterized membrane protein (UPF0182 family)